jgi:hypothetical protein
VTTLSILKEELLFKARTGGILTLSFLAITIIISSIFSNDNTSKIPIVVEYNLDVEKQKEKVKVPSFKIIYGFPINISDNLEVILNVGELKNR